MRAISQICFDKATELCENYECQRGSADSPFWAHHQCVANRNRNTNSQQIENTGGAVARQGSRLLLGVCSSPAGAGEKGRYGPPSQNTGRYIIRKVMFDSKGNLSPETRAPDSNPGRNPHVRLCQLGKVETALSEPAALCNGGGIQCGGDVGGHDFAATKAEEQMKVITLTQNQIGRAHV
jgi:hypothetical protein